MYNYTQSAFLASGTYASSIVSMLLRNILFARLLSPYDFSIALTFGVVLSLFEYMTSFGHEMLMQRSEHGNKERFQATMQSVMVLRGFSIAAFIVLISPTIASFLNVQSSVFNYALLAVVPFINGFTHLDPQRLHRQNNFVITAKIGITADIASIVMALLCALIWSSYWAFYISFVFRHSISTVLSHFWASRPYRLALNKDYIFELWHFGLPLVAVGILKYFGTEIDKALIASYSGLHQFTLYFLTMMITANAANIIAVGLSKIFIRRISTATQDQLSHTAYGNGVITLYLALPLLLTITIFGELIIRLVFGTQYPPIPYLIPAVVTLVAIRQLSHWLNQIVVGGNETKLILYADMVRILVLAIGLLIVVKGEDVRLFTLAFILCELAYVIFLSKLLSKSVDGIRKYSLILLAITVMSSSVFYVLYWLTYDNNTFIYKAAYYLASMFILLGFFNASSALCRAQSLKLLRVIQILLMSKFRPT
ncbi:oligosaccharide flippase family protein [Arenicella xantha]|uniref:O-antigen/teichoic acid export membrane protein n=1 Tax=Arenicella xantha TaxID=644221 RepID=A0A395JRI2_9GAMM|nr:oligosaccharide flippase family protein [Arenicella xantha]RBP52942.1 O-antigen/teichoic acid export membrane protein [Arenicella xantha]